MRSEPGSVRVHPGMNDQRCDSTKSGLEIRSDEGMRILSYLLAGLLFYGGLGYVGSVVFEAVWLIPVGIILGIALSIYTIIKRFGSVE